jgi:hypothetical protein
LQLWGDQELVRIVCAIARRHFRDAEDQKDARADVWEAIERAPVNLSLAEYQKIAYRVVNAKYKRERRRQRREVRMA